MSPPSITAGSSKLPDISRNLAAAIVGSNRADCHAGHFHQEDLLQVTNLVEHGALEINPLIRDIVPIDQAPEIYQRLVNRPDTLLGTVFIWSSVGDQGNDRGGHQRWRDG